MCKSKKKFAFREVLTLLCFVLGSSVSFAQEKPVTVSFTNARLQSVLSSLEAQSGYLFVYGDNVDVNQTVSVQADARPLSAVLGEVLGAAGIGYSVSNTSIVLSPKVQTPPKAVSGIVRGAGGEPVAGAMVSVKGTGVVAISMSDGGFSLTVPAGVANPVLAVSFLGYQSAEVAVGERSAVTVSLREDATEIDQVVVTALGIKRSEKALSYNVQTVASDQVTTVKDANFMNALSGKVAGLSINASAGGVGAASKVQMRGSRSIEQSSNALYVINGVPMMNPSREPGSFTGYESGGYTDLMADINPEDIESISVLMGAAAAALYGSIASNGAVIINTKAGSADKTTLTFSQNTDFITAFWRPDFQTRYGTSLDNRNESWGAKLSKSGYRGYEPFDDYFRTGVTTTETVSLSTGTAKNQTYVSAAAVNSEGIIPNAQYDRYNFTFRNTAKFLQDKMTLDVGATYARQRDLNMTSQGIMGNPVLSAYLYPRGNDWNNVRMYETWDVDRQLSVQNWDMDQIAPFYLQNPYWINYRMLKENRRNHYSFNANLSYQVFDWLRLSGRVNLDTAHDTGTEKIYASSNGQYTGTSNNGYYAESNTVTRQTYADFLAHINKDFGVDWSLNATLGTSIHDVYSDYHRVGGGIRDGILGGEAISIPNVFNLYTISNSMISKSLSGYREQMQSVFGSAEVGYRNTYFLTATLRTDWPSQLAGGASTRSSFTYPSIGASAVLSQAFDLPDWLSYLKVRGSYANVGLSFARYIANPTYENSGGVYSDKTSYPVSDLKPEFTHSWEFGLTARFFRHWNLDFTFYNTNTVDQLLQPQVSASSSYSTMYIQNGDVLNRGIELSLGYKNTWGGFSWNSNFTLSSNRNKVLKLAGEITNSRGERVPFSQLQMGGLGSVKFLLKEGGTLGDLYSMADLKRDSKGNIYIGADGNVTRVDISGGDSGDWIKLGSIFPKANLGWRNDFSWKNLSAGFLFTARLGGVVYSRTQATLDAYGVSEVSAAARDSGGVVLNGGDTVSPRKWFGTIGSGDGIPQYYTYDATNVRLSEASVSYKLPKKWLRVADVTVSLVGRNLWMIYCKAPFDPEAAATVNNNYFQGIDNYMSPSTRNIGFSVRVNF